MNRRELLLGLAEEEGRAPLEAEFLRAIADDPDDEATRAAYADWLEENGQEQMALYLRLDLERARTHRSAERFPELGHQMAALEEGLDPRWYSAVARLGRILNCGKSGTQDQWLRFRFHCPNRWSDLTSTSNPHVRFCGDCRKTVALCLDAEQAKQVARDGACIAINSRTALDVLPELEKDGPRPDDEFEIEMGLFDDSDTEWAEVMRSVKPPAPAPPPPTKPWWQFW